MILQILQILQKMDESGRDEVSTSADENDSDGDGDLIGGLESLLEEEGVSLEEDDSLNEDDLGDIFSDGENEEDADEAAPAAAATSSRQRRGGGRNNRQERRRGDAEAFKNLDAQIRLTPMGIQVSDDQLQATISRITPESTFEEILGLLKKHKISVGIDNEGIRSALAKARNGQVQYDVLVARGRPPQITKDAEAIYHLPKELTEEAKGGKMTPFERLKSSLDGPHVEAVKSWQGAVKVVRKGDVIAEVSAANVEPGEDVYGGAIAPEVPNSIALKSGDNTTVADDGKSCLADIYGFAGLVEGVPTVLPPIWISEDHMEARFVHLASEEPIPTPTEADLQELLDLRWIEYGVLDQQIELVRKRLERNLPLPVTLPIAQGTQEVQGENATIQYAFDPYSIMPWNQLQTTWGMGSEEEIANCLAGIREETPELVFTAFRSADTVVEKVPATEGITGTDIQGEEIVPEEGQDAPLEPGENLTLTEDGHRCLSDCFGYVCLRYDVQISILSPIWIAPDKIKAYFVNMPQGEPKKYPGISEIQELLNLNGIVFGFSAEVVAERFSILEAGDLDDLLIPLAEGTPSQNGNDAEFEWAIEIEQRRPGKILDDGSIDYRERNLTTVVKEGDLLGRLLPPTAGVPGKDIFGNELIPPQPVNIEVITDSRIYAEADDEGLLAFFAEVGGGISANIELKKVKGRTHKRINVGVNPTSNIEGDIDYTTGNIDFNGDVVIGGSVHPQFSVKATGSVTIEGYVEAGAYITAGEDILIKRGVVGASTELVAGGDIMAKYIQEATVRAGGDVKAGSYIFNASVRGGGTVVVMGKGEGKSRALVGGLIWGARAVTAKSIGSPYNTGTRLVTGVDPDLVNRAEQIHANMQTCQEKQRKVMESIGVPSLDVELIKQKLARTRNPKDKKAILMGVKRVAKVAELEQNLEKELEEIGKQQQDTSMQAGINVANEFFSGVELRIGEETLSLQEDKSKVSFRLVKEEDELKIQEEPFKARS